MTNSVNSDSRALRPATSPVARLARAAANRWKVTIGVWVGVLVLGGLAWFVGLAREGFPPVNLPIAVVSGTYFVDDPDTVDADVAVPLTEAYSAIPGVAEVQSFAQDNSFAIVVEFDDEFSSPEGAALLEAANPGSGVAADADVDVRALDATKFVEVYDVLVSVSGDQTTSALELEAVAAELAAGLEASSDIDRAEVRELLTEGVNPATGENETRLTRFTRVAYDDTDSFDNGIAIGLVRSEAANLDVLEFSDSVNDTLAGLDVPAGFRAEVTADFATEIRSQLSSLTGNLFTGLVAVAIVSLLLIGWRVSIVTAGFMATVMLAALIGLWFTGYSLNTITLFGLILTLGLLVDDAIVISESIDASRSESDDPVEVVGSAVQQVGSASFSGTLTTVLVFAPMLFVGGVLGEFIRAIPATVIITLLLSFLFSVTFIPAIARGFLLRGAPPSNPIIRAENRGAAALGRLAAYPAGNGVKGWLVGAGLLAFAVVSIFSSFGIAGRVGFNIFPPTKDSNGLQVTADFDPGTTIEQAQEIATDIDNAVLSVLGDDLVRAQYVRGNERLTFSFIDLTPFDERSTTSPEFAEQIEEATSGLDGVRISSSPLENGPPVDDFPFAVQIEVADGQIAAGEQLAADIAEQITGVTLDKTGDTTVIVETLISTAGEVVRFDGQQIIEVRASFSTDDTTNNLNATESLVQDLFPEADLAGRGLAPDALQFDFGQQSDNEDDFASLGVAFMIALALMFLLLVIQFRSVVQPALILLAIPFSFLGVFSILLWSDNSLSFFVMVGFIALIGVVVNNTILLIDSANQARRDGLIPAAAIARAVTRRARPLVATTITTVVGLLPLALSDPFWEALSFTLIGGLVSSTITVLIAFPVIYLGVEKARRTVRNFFRSRMGRELVV